MRYSNVSIGRKLRIFKSCVVTVLMYGLRTIWLGAPSRRRLDGFQARCIRTILKVPAAYVSRVTNATVRERAGVTPLSSELLQQQLILFFNIAVRETGSSRNAVLSLGSVALVEAHGRRSRGRPWHTWADQVRKRAVTIAGGEARLSDILGDEALWKFLVSEHTADYK